MQMTFRSSKSYLIEKLNVLTLSFQVNEDDLEQSKHKVLLHATQNLEDSYYYKNNISLLDIQELLKTFYHEDILESSSLIFDYFGAFNFQLVKIQDFNHVEDLFKNTSRKNVVDQMATHGKFYERRNWGKGDLKVFLKKKYEILVDKKAFYASEIERLKPIDNPVPEPLYSF